MHTAIGIPGIDLTGNCPDPQISIHSCASDFTKADELRAVLNQDVFLDDDRHVEERSSRHQWPGGRSFESFVPSNDEKYKFGARRLIQSQAFQGRQARAADVGHPQIVAKAL